MTGLSGGGGCEGAVPGQSGQIHSAPVIDPIAGVQCLTLLEAVAYAGDGLDSQAIPPFQGRILERFETPNSREFGAGSRRGFRRSQDGGNSEKGSFGGKILPLIVLHGREVAIVARLVRASWAAGFCPDQIAMSYSKPQRNPGLK